MLSKNYKIILVNDSVYDFTTFNHPGNIQVFNNKLGNDVSNDYYFHSTKAKKVWQKYFIGKLIKN